MTADLMDSANQHRKYDPAKEYAVIYSPSDPKINSINNSLEVRMPFSIRPSLVELYKSIITKNALSLRMLKSRFLIVCCKCKFYIELETDTHRWYTWSPHDLRQKMLQINRYKTSTKSNFGMHELMGIYGSHTTF